MRGAVMKTLLLCIISFITLSLIVDGCTTTPIPEPVPMPLSEPAHITLPKLYINQVINKASYYQGQTIELEFMLANVGDKIIYFKTFPPETAILNNGIPIRKFPGGTEPKSLSPGESANFTITWDQIDKDGQQVPYGYYGGFFADLNLTVEKVEITIGTVTPLRIVPEGIMRDETIELNESKTTDGITFTLERVEFTPFGTTIHAFCRPPNYVPGFVIDIYAFYKIDDGMRKSAGKAKIERFVDGVRFIWSKLEPVTKNSKVYTFSITGFNYGGENWRHPWEFRVALQ